MTALRAYSVYVGHMRDAIEHALSFTAGTDYEQFAADDRTVYATVRALEILGEAAKRLPEEIRALDPTIPWRRMAGMRDVIIHEYERVDLREVWQVVRNGVPPLLPRLEALQRLLEHREDEEWERETGEQPNRSANDESHEND